MVSFLSYTKNYMVSINYIHFILVIWLPTAIWFLVTSTTTTTTTNNNNNNNVQEI